MSQIMRILKIIRNPSILKEGDVSGNRYISKHLEPIPKPTYPINYLEYF